jgi:hypothetical protein
MAQMPCIGQGLEQRQSDVGVEACRARSVRSMMALRLLRA